MYLTWAEVLLKNFANHHDGVIYFSITFKGS